MSDGNITISANNIDLQDCIVDYCIQPTIARIDAIAFPPQTNCRNCGAPLDRNKDCPYCGTKSQMRSGITMSSDSISFFAG